MGGGGSARNEYVGNENSVNSGGGGSSLYIVKGLNNTAIMNGGGGCNEVHAYGDNTVVAGSHLVIEAHGVLRLNSYGRYVYVNGRSGPLTPTINVVIAAP